MVWMSGSMWREMIGKAVGGTEETPDIICNRGSLVGANFWVVDTLQLRFGDDA